MGTLKSVCGDILLPTLTVDSVIDVLLLADKYRADSFKSKCINFIVENSYKVTRSSSYERLNEDHPNLALEVIRQLTLKYEKPQEGEVDSKKGIKK